MPSLTLTPRGHLLFTVTEDALQLSVDHQPELLFTLRKVDQQDLIAKAGSDLSKKRKGPAGAKVLVAHASLREVYEAATASSGCALVVVGGEPLASELLGVLRAPLLGASTESAGRSCTAAGIAALSIASSSVTEACICGGFSRTQVSWARLRG